MVDTACKINHTRYAQTFLNSVSFGTSRACAKR
jgi:hypothetical protein